MRHTLTDRHLVFLQTCTEADRDAPSSQYGASLGALHQHVRRAARPICLDNGTAMTGDQLATVMQATLLALRTDGPRPTLSGFAAISAMECQRIRANALDRYTRDAATMSRDGRTDDSQLTQTHETHAAVARRYYTDTAAEYQPMADFAVQQRGLNDDLNQKLADVLRASAQQREIVSTATETMTVFSNASVEHVGSQRRTAWFHDDVSEKYHQFADKTVSTRERLEQRNGDIRLTSWTVQGTFRVFLREDVHSYTEDSGLAWQSRESDRFRARCWARDIFHSGN